MERYSFAGYGGCESVCGVTRSGNIIVLTELDDNNGTSITNAVTILATDLCEQFGIALDAVRVIERYPTFGRKAKRLLEDGYTYSMAKLEVREDYFNGRTVQFRCSEYEPISEAEVEALMQA